jgi:hypothetical protein
MAQLTVVVTFSFSGVHSWPGCPDGAVQFLRHPHRHLFAVEGSKAVTHAEREVEIVGLRDAMLQHCLAHFSGPHHLSCESMALALAEAFGLVRCRVLEDGENGAEVWA